MVKLVSYFFCFFLLWALSCSAFASIEHYQRTFIPLYTPNGELRIAIRQFFRDNKVYFLVVDPYHYTTSIVKAGQSNMKNRAKNSAVELGDFEWNVVKETPYIKDLLRFTKYPSPLQNAGLTHSVLDKKGFFLTVDMCPSVKSFEKDFFLQLITLGKSKKPPFPVAISISGLWALEHKQEFNWLLQMQRKHKLNITWVNHSFSHLYFQDLPLRENFLLFFQTNLENELLAIELLLLNKKQLPSVFIRFPGLISDKFVLETSQRLGLIPLGSDAWLAKNQVPKDGSIILVHGNGNEHAGIHDVMAYLKDPNRTWLPIAQACN